MTIDVEPGSNLMNVLLNAGLPVASSCHGDGVCSMCRVQIEGEANEPAEYEIASMKRNSCDSDERLSCQVIVNSDLKIYTRYW